MEEAKNVTVTSGSASRPVEVYPGDSAEQVLTLAIPELGLNTGGSYHLLLNGAEVHEDLYKQVKDGDKLTIAETGEGGSR